METEQSSFLVFHTFHHVLGLPWLLRCHHGDWKRAIDLSGIPDSHCSWGSYLDGRWNVFKIREQVLLHGSKYCQLPGPMFFGWIGECSYVCGPIIKSLELAGVEFFLAVSPYFFIGPPYLFIDTNMKHAMAILNVCRKIVFMLSIGTFICYAVFSFFSFSDFTPSTFVVLCDGCEYEHPVQLGCHLNVHGISHTA